MTTYRTIEITRPFHPLMRPVRLRVSPHVASMITEYGMPAVEWYCTPRQIRKTRCSPDCCCRASFIETR